MENTTRRVVVTGAGAVTPVGSTVPEMWNSLISGKNGIAPISLFDTSDFKVKVAAEVKEHLVFIPCKTAHDVLDEALLPAAGEPQIEAPVIPVINAQSARA